MVTKPLLEELLLYLESINQSAHDLKLKSFGLSRFPVISQWLQLLREKDANIASARAISIAK